MKKAAASAVMSSSATAANVRSPLALTGGDTANRLVEACCMIAKRTLP
jgi:hypothetical protein